MPVMRFLTVAIVLWACSACASDPGAGARVAGPFTERHAQLFDDSVDMVENPQDLSGAWLDDWEKELDERFAESNVIAKGRVITLRTDQDLEQRTTFHIVVKVDEVLEGKHGGEELNLRVAQGEPGYANVERYREQMLNKPFVAFVRWYKDASGVAGEHFHLSTPSKHLLQRLDRLLANKRPSTVRIIERTN